MNFLSTYSNLLKNFSFADYLMIEDNGFADFLMIEGTLRKDPVIAAFAEQLKITTLRKFNW